jgi:diguanylate cyclase (GGDEF)-like protein
MSDKPEILLVDDEAPNLDALARTLKADFNVTLCTHPEEALEKVKSHPFSVVISDQRMPQMGGTEFLSRVARLSPHSTRLILTAFTEPEAILDAINRAEIYRYITKPWDNAELISTIRQAAERHSLLVQNQRLLEELREANQVLERKVSERTEELRHANERLSELALTDSLTRIANRRALFRRFQEEVHRAERYGRSIAVAMVDVDHFKSFNDMEGHLCGDESLKKIAAVLSSNLRKTDFVGRYGGEEFIVLVPETQLAQAMETFVRLKSAVEGTVFQGREKAAYLTVSLGVSLYPKHGDNPKALIEAADHALFEAKQGGRNRIVVAD